MSNHNKKAFAIQIKALASKIHAEHFGKILEPDGSLTYLAALRIAEMEGWKQDEVIGELIKNGIVGSKAEAWRMIANKTCSDPKGGIGVCEPAPMSDDVLDRGTQYLTISQYILRTKEEE